MTAFTPDRLLRRLRTRTAGGIVTISTYDAGPADDGRHRIGYVCERDHAEIFRGTDIDIPSGQAIDSDHTVAAVIGFLSLQPGDTDPEFFDHYTADQAAFADSCAAELALLGDMLTSDIVPRSRPTGTGEQATIGATRTVLERMRADAGELARDLETLQAHLATAELDQATLGEIADILDAAAICRMTAATALAGLNARHTAMEEAVNTTPHPAKTRFYRH
jgi:hypothetical protein